MVCPCRSYTTVFVSRVHTLSAFGMSWIAIHSDCCEKHVRKLCMISSLPREYQCSRYLSHVLARFSSVRNAWTEDRLPVLAES
ncbi:hypothetical protein HBI56_171800 [Parastagonospora nodorum]|uniref:Uncharacterized protein n=1 Tax=Phaeosphaeria nodorum (strain SN15 / ATCC MYA-4574 / FGSC 10173) TaxID=321614 RepID=A0A7U2F5U8_PHANO|nr:hypothetical protein HBH56_234610 [Parastagonospora nodorum]QRC97099.1 hypothetical protein JI435_410090 [Parastagonospora nodorum SN15]KAH3921343.1 hypothetical protein HBH54_242670 [Parastagonospora nodorum]KAH3944611.1 hypothetical protein HBH53_157580 [Parastagonospora nodorum]KAH3959416.1 hypothetical protein HBH52_244380 [Parastagonospora nodorum]